MRGGLWVLVTALLVGGCAGVSGWIEEVAPGSWGGEARADRGSGSGSRLLGRAARVAAHPGEAPPGERGDQAAWRRALELNGERIVVSRDALQLWLMRGDSVLFQGPVAVGRDTIFRYGSREWDFNTPTGTMRVRGKEESPLWVPPDWHYLEKAVERGLEPVYLRGGQRVTLSDSTVIHVRGLEVGRINRYGNWHPFSPGGEIVFDGQIFIPPIGSPQRRIPVVLGTHRLILGDGYLIHGTPEEDSIGEWASHGCIRMFNSDIAELYELVSLGTPVIVY
jgi:hypothetical protein